MGSSSLRGGKLPCGGGKDKRVGAARGGKGQLADEGLRGADAGATLEGMRWVALVIGGALVGSQAAPQVEQASAPAAAITYTQVAPIFAAKCASCHDSRQSDNKKAQRVYEMSSYPFATARPNTLLADLKKTFATRGSLTADEKQLGQDWIAGGALDAEGKPPRWRDSE
jgi:hypothetical protein